MPEWAAWWAPPWALGSATVPLVLLVALAADRALGEPPVRWHPVVWMGRALGWVGQRIAPATDTGRDLKSFWLAALSWCALAAMVLIVAALLQAVVLALLPLAQGPYWHAGAAVLQPPGSSLPGATTALDLLRLLLASVLLGLLLKPLMALALLQSEVRAVEAALAESLDAGRARLAWLVSRDVAQLSAEEVRQSAIESLAENLNDSVVAPLFWFVIAGLPGAALYRLANTADAMWGYPGLREGRYWQWAGKWAARADDVLSWLPARITALLLALAAGGVPLRTLAQEARKTPSPNSGWPMAAMALALGVHLSKPGVYGLHTHGRAPAAGDMEQAQKLVSKVARALVLVALSALILIALWRLQRG
ncbi:MAG: adenosylcobinamide-phosphate synthase CbiB [Simplicispira sp.]|nr:adenosylcobinamide-phosphate synthase CbiB [Simplicispira sp.]